METKRMIPRVLETETFGEGKRHYFMDIKRAKNNSCYLRISRSDKVEEDKYQRSQLVVFEQDLVFFVEALAMVLNKWSHRESITQKQLTLWSD